MAHDHDWLNIPEERRREMLQAARDFRKSPTDSEMILWQALRRKQLAGIKFRRQQPIGPFVVDFYAPLLSLVVEVDGGIHDLQKEADHVRQRILEDLGYRVIRFTAEAVEQDLSAVLAMIVQVGKTPLPPAPSPSGGEGGK